MRQQKEREESQRLRKELKRKEEEEQEEQKEEEEKEKEAPNSIYTNSRSTANAAAMFYNETIEEPDFDAKTCLAPPNCIENCAILVFKADHFPQIFIVRKSKVANLSKRALPKFREDQS